MSIENINTSTDTQEPGARARRTGILARFVDRLGSPGGRKELERSPGPLNFTLKVGDHTVIATLDTTPVQATIDEELLHPPTGQVAIIISPGQNGSLNLPPYHVYRVIEQGESALWVCDEVKASSGGRPTEITRLEDPMEPFRMAQGADEKSRGLMSRITRPAGTQILVTRSAEVEDIAKVTEEANGNPLIADYQGVYQNIINGVLASNH